MDNGKIILIFLVIIVTGVSIFLLFRNTVMTTQAETATTVNTEVLTFFSNAGVKCRATEYEPGKILTCLKDYNKKFKGADVDKYAFLNVDKNGSPGYLTVKNKIAKPLNSTDFTLLHNLALVSTGCENMNGTLNKDYTCKLIFTNPCQKGDVLEVQYQGNRAYVENC